MWGNFMITDNSFTSQWIQSIKFAKQVHYETLEKVIYAMHLLEELVKSEIFFVFKGGSSLLLHFEDLQRFSIDIDILIDKNNYDLMRSRLDRIVGLRFIECLEDVRKPTIFEKHHFKFYYNSAFRSDIQPYVLLDIVVDSNPYINIHSKAIASNLLDINEPIYNVNVPSPEEMLGDKLTAFAPNSVGITYNSEKYTEIVKQMFDCSRLIAVCKDYEVVKDTYIEICHRELLYRGLNDYSWKNCVEDTIETCKTIISQGKYGDKSKYDLLRKNGIDGFSNYVVGNFGVHDGIKCAIDIYIYCVMIKCQSLHEYTKIVETFEKNKLESDFVGPSNFKFLRLIYGEKFIEFQKAIFVENCL